MAFTKRTIITWNSPDQRTDPTIDQAKLDKLEAMVAEGKTDQLPIALDDVTTIRIWRDQAAADEWVGFIQELTAPLGYTASIVIEDIAVIGE